jgi:hypothetical protein
MALPSPTSVFLHHIFDGVGYESANIYPTLTMLFGEEEDMSSPQHLKKLIRSLDLMSS